jgi:hypothetical protein
MVYMLSLGVSSTRSAHWKMVLLLRFVVISFNVFGGWLVLQDVVSNVRCSPFDDVHFACYP